MNGFDLGTLLIGWKATCQEGYVRLGVLMQGSQWEVNGK